MKMHDRLDVRKKVQFLCVYFSIFHRRIYDRTFVNIMVDHYIR